MSLFKLYRRYRFSSLLFGLCLTLVLWSGLPSAAAPPLTTTNPDHNVPLPTAIAEQPRSSIAPASTPAPTLSLTQGVRKTVLDNGLTILTKEVNTAPVVTVQVWYRVGSRNETPGINGIAHQLEHLMFKGTKERPIQFGQFFSALGSESNAFTSYDMTAYFGTVEHDKLEALLVLEADRMNNAVIADNELTSEKRVVISELQGYENSPSYRLGRAVMKAAFPNHPYGLPVGGTKADVERFTVEQVRDYYRTFYRPDNATLILVGNFRTEDVLKTVKATFGQVSKPNLPLPSEPTTAALTSSDNPPQAPIVLREAGSAALLNAVYPLPNINHPDLPALQVMDYILTGGRSSRLYQTLVESGLASSAEGGTNNLIGAGWYEFSVTAAPGKTLAEIDQALQQMVAELRQRGVTQEELDRAKTQLRAAIILRNRDITSQAMQLGDDYLTTGNYQFTDRLLNAIATVSASDIQRVAQTYLSPNHRTVGFFEPTQTDGKVVSRATSAAQTSENFSSGTPVDPAEIAKYLPPITATQQDIVQPLPEKLTLANGLQVLLLRDRSTPTITLSGYVQAGSFYDKAETAGLANLVAANLMNGTQTQDALTLAKILENRGASLEFGVNREGVTISGDALATDLPALVQVLADVLENANFPADELELSRQRALTNLDLELDNPTRLARRVFQQAIYPENHPFHSFPTKDSLKRITREAMQQFYQTHYRPDATVLTLVGNFEPSQIRNLLNQTLGQWQDKGKEAQITVPSVTLPKTVTRLNPTLPGKTQSITFIGYNAIDRRDPRYYTAMVLNQILGGDTLSSRLGTEIRDRLGLTYGIYSYFQAGIYSGPFLIYMQTAPEDADRAITSTLTLLQQVRDRGVTAAEVANAKRSLASMYPVGLADPSVLADTILMNQVYGLSLKELQEFTDKINAVTPEQVDAAIKELLHPDRVVVVTAGPEVTTSQKQPQSP
ncbi:M16 family metallopeptidase [Pantanalinema sp. GBBB05]|uniref:M16 family metallopeptidase n=1 Tax=Pantanalinema sp. GBBB05 TaxID=2604139 RepID=UPI001E12FCCD|nr:insulinase family protein [Pantanalinema sp. GBBB05]